MGPTREELPLQFGPYILISLLGEGGMARVYRAVREGPEGFRKEVAIKRIRADLTRDDDVLVQSLINEARLGGQLRHPNVVDVYEFGVVDGQHYITMEFVNGLTLDALIAGASRRGTHLPRGVVLDLALQVCDGLEYAHGQITPEGRSLRLVHRDLKPSNIVVSTVGQAKIMDFGIARSRASQFKTSRADIAKGTLIFMSPEQLDDPLGLDHRSDLFAVGAVLFQALTGEVLVDAPTTHAAMWQIVSGEFRTRLALIDEVFPEIRPILSRCLEVDRDKRYPDAAELGEDLRVLREQTGERLGCRELMLLVAAAREGAEELERAREKVLSRDSGSEATTDWPLFASTLESDPDVTVDPLSLPSHPPISDTSGIRSSLDPALTADATVMWQADDSLVPRPMPVVDPRSRRTWITGLTVALALVLLAILGLWRPWEGPQADGPRDPGPPAPRPDAEEAAPAVPPGGEGATEAVEGSTGGPLAPARESETGRPAPGSGEAEVGEDPAAESATPARAENATPAPPEPESPAANAPPVHVFVNSVPWANYTLSGDVDQKGNTPFNQQLAPGTYRFHLTEPRSGKEHVLPLHLDGSDSEVSRCWNFNVDGPC